MPILLSELDWFGHSSLEDVFQKMQSTPYLKAYNAPNLTPC